VIDYNLIEDHISQYFTIKGFQPAGDGSYFIISKYSPDRFSQLIQDLDEIGYTPFINRYDEYYYIRIAKKPEEGKPRVIINVLLLLATIASTIFAGYLFGGKIVDGLAFSAAIMGIIGTHELAHFFAARKHGIKATLPYFVPAPTIIGTFGAVINVKSPIPNKKALFDLGVSGPLAGIVVTVVVLIIGIHYSTVAPIQGESLKFFPPLIMIIISYFVAPTVPPGYLLMIHPVAFAGWVGVIITMLNLMPVAFLDGGHISRSIFSVKIHQILSILGIIVTLILGWIPMAILMMVILFMTKKHPGALDNVSTLTRDRKIIAVLALVVLILCLSPIPNYLV
jgi:membrane-associated protease RseP (regulator of RpoE activity)